MPRRYSPKASKSVARAMHKEKRGTLRTGKSGRKVKNAKQAIAIGLSETRQKGAKVPPKKSLGAHAQKTAIGSRRSSSKRASSNSKMSRQRSQLRTNSR